MLLPYSEVLLISSDNDKHTVKYNEAQNVNKDSLWEQLYINSNEHWIDYLNIRDDWNWFEPFFVISLNYSTEVK